MDAVFGQFCSARTAEFCPQMIFPAAPAAMIAHFSGGHGNKQASCAFDDFDVPDDERVVEGHRAKSLQAVILVGHKFDSDFADFHSLPREHSYHLLMLTHLLSQLHSFFSQRCN